jgi:hypothetical protein
MAMKLNRDSLRDTLSFLFKEAEKCPGEKLQHYVVAIECVQKQLLMHSPGHDVKEFYPDYK